MESPSRGRCSVCSQTPRNGRTARAVWEVLCCSDKPGPGQHTWAALAPSAVAQGARDRGRASAPLVAVLSRPFYFRFHLLARGGLGAQGSGSGLGNRMLCSDPKDSLVLPMVLVCRLLTSLPLEFNLLPLFPCGFLCDPLSSSVSVSKCLGKFQVCFQPLWMLM